MSSPERPFYQKDRSFLYVEHEEPSLYGLLNAGTNVLWHRRAMTAADFQNNDAFTTGLLG